MVLASILFIFFLQKKNNLSSLQSSSYSLLSIGNFPVHALAFNLFLGRLISLLPLHVQWRASFDILITYILCRCFNHHSLHSFTFIIFLLLHSHVFQFHMHIQKFVICSDSWIVFRDW